MRKITVLALSTMLFAVYLPAEAQQPLTVPRIGWVTASSLPAMTARIEAQIERFAPGFRKRILARHTTTPADLERYNPNLVGGAVAGGAADWTQLFTRPVVRLDPYSTPNPRVWASVPTAKGAMALATRPML